LSSTRSLRTRRSHLIFAPSATHQSSSGRGGPIHQNNRYAFLRYATRPCSRASLTAARLYCCGARRTGVSDPGYSHSAITSGTGPGYWSRTSSRCRSRPGCRCRSRRRCSCRSCCWCRSSCWRNSRRGRRRGSRGRCRRRTYCRCRSRATRWKDTHVVNVLFMPANGVRVDVVGGGIRYIASSIV
jgi:hypothetical protein